MTNHIGRLADGALILIGITVIATIILSILAQPTPSLVALALFTLAFVAAYAIGYGMEVYDD